MRDVLEMCIELDTMAAETYRSLASACTDPEVATLFEHLAAEEDSHVGWWSELLESWDSGLIPDIVTDPDAILKSIREVQDDVRASIPSDPAALSPADMLEVAVHLEFFLLDPLFAELLDLTEPGRTGHHRDAYARHIDRLVGAIERHAANDSLSRFLARVLKRALRDNVRLATLATRDPLTGLYNRRGMLGHLTQWVSWAARYGRPIMVLLIDIDHFKTVNDTHGHLVGDTVLKSVAGAIGSSTRESDFVARYGGDEFAVVAPETDADEFAALTKRILTAVRDVRCPGRDGVDVRVSVSIGGAVLTPGFELTPSTIDLLLAGADASMYEAKATGRDQAGVPALVDSLAPASSAAR